MSKTALLNNPWTYLPKFFKSQSTLIFFDSGWLYQAYYWPKHLTSKIYQTQLRVFSCKQLRNCTQWVFIYPTDECEAFLEELISRSLRIFAFVEVQVINVFIVTRQCTLHRTSWIDPLILAHIFQVYFNVITHPGVPKWNLNFMFFD